MLLGPAGWELWWPGSSLDFLEWPGLRHGDMAQSERRHGGENDMSFFLFGEIADGEFATGFDSFQNLPLLKPAFAAFHHRLRHVAVAKRG